MVFRTGKEDAPYKLVGVMITSTHGELASISCYLLCRKLSTIFQ